MQMAERYVCVFQYCDNFRSDEFCRLKTNFRLFFWRIYVVRIEIVFIHEDNGWRFRKEKVSNCFPKNCSFFLEKSIATLLRSRLFTARSSPPHSDACLNDGCLPLQVWWRWLSFGPELGSDVQATCCEKMFTWEERWCVCFFDMLVWFVTRFSRVFVWLVISGVSIIGQTLVNLVCYTSDA